MSDRNPYPYFENEPGGYPQINQHPPHPAANTTGAYPAPPVPPPSSVLYDQYGNQCSFPPNYSEYYTQNQYSHQVAQNVIAYYDHLRTNTNFSYNDPAVYAEKERLAVENERYRCREKYRKMNEEAYTKIEVTYKNCMLTQKKNGEMVKLADFNIASAHKVKLPDGTVKYILYLTTKPEDALELTQKEYFNDKILLSALEEHSGKPIMTCKTLKHTANMMRQAISTSIRQTELPYQGGWTEIDGNPRFLEYANGSTHTEQDSLEVPHVLPERRTPEVRACAAEKFIGRFLRLRNKITRSILFLVFHIALLSSLLRDLGYQIPGGLYLSLPDARVQAYVQDILTCFHDPVVSLDAAPGLFTRSLAEWKDEIMLIDDSRLTSHSAKNCETLRAAVATGSLVDQNGIARMLNSFPVVLSSQISDLGSFSHLLNLDLHASDIEWPSFVTDGVQTETDPHSYVVDYLTFVENEIGTLRRDLEAGRQWALAEGDSELTVSAVEFLGLFHGMGRFLKHGYSSLGLPDIFDEVVPSEVFSEVPACLAEMAVKASGDSEIADEFLFILREEIKLHRDKNVFFPRDKYCMKRSASMTRALFYDDHYVFVSSAKVDQICRRMRYSRPVVLDALAEAKYSAGKPINGAAKLSRIGVKNLDGVTIQLPVLKLPWDIVDEFGEVPMNEI